MLVELRTRNSSALIDDFGAELKSLKLYGREIIWCGDERYWGKTSPILFPMIGNLHGGTTLINNKPCEIGKHGFARDNRFLLVKKTDASAIFTYRYTDTKEGKYPFPCTLSLIYSLYDDKLSIKYRVTNLTSKKMYYCIGTHPAIACDNLDNCSLQFEKRESADTPVMNLDTRMFESKNRITRLIRSSRLNLTYDMFDNDVVYFDEIKSRKFTLREKNKVLAAIEFEGFTSLGLWTPAGKRAGFLCIEGWCGSDDYDNDDGHFEHKKGVQFITGKGNKEYSMTISEG